MKPADRMQRIPLYIFDRIKQMKKAVEQRGIEILDFGMGDPDLPTPEHIIDRLRIAAGNPRHHRYPPYTGISELKKAAAAFYQRRYGVELDPEREVLAVIGSKEGLTHLLWAFVNEGQPVLLPDPAYPVYDSQARLIGARVVPLPMTEENNFLIDLDAIDPAMADAASLMVTNYPSNPTGATADLAFFDRAVAYARAHDLILCNDFAYGDITFNGYRAPSVLQVPGAKDVAVEFYSLSKPFNMTGWRIGFLLGNASVLKEVARLKSNVDAGQFGGIQEAAIEALENNPEKVFERINRVYADRIHRFVPGLRAMGIRVPETKATFYVWAHVPAGETSESFAVGLLEKEGVVVTPGSGLGQYGEGYVRFSLTVPDEHIEKALPRIKRYLGQGR